MVAIQNIIFALSVVAPMVEATKASNAGAKKFFGGLIGLKVRGTNDIWSRATFGLDPDSLGPTFKGCSDALKNAAVEKGTKTSVAGNGDMTFEGYPDICVSEAKAHKSKPDGPHVKVNGKTILVTGIH